MRVAFVGQAMYFTSTVPHEPAGGLEPHFLDHRGGREGAGLRARLDGLAPDVVVVFRPEILAPGLLDGLGAITLGFSTEPLPRGGGAHPDQLFRLSELAQADGGQFDRIVTFDPLSAPSAAAAGLPVWRSLPLPVDDRFFAAVRAPATPPRVAFIGYSTGHRERWLIDAKHDFDVLHVAWGLHGDALRERMARIDVALNVHHSPYPSFENRVLLHLAAGHLVVSEPLSPRHGLRPGVELLEVHSPRALVRALAALRSMPGAHDDVRRAGRRAAERFRASRVWPRLLGDLERDVGAFGTARRGRPAAA